MHYPAQTIWYLLAGLTLLALPKNVSDSSVDLASMIDVAPTAAADNAHSLLRKITRSITTVTAYRDGTVEHNSGIGFVTGSRYFTVYHNLEAGRPVDVESMTTRVDGRQLTPIYGDARTDLAVFDMSTLDCFGLCENPQIVERAQPEPGAKVFWLWASHGDASLHEGRVVEFAWLGDAASRRTDINSCDDNLVALIDQPFKPGSSGSAVVDEYGRLLGIVQGSLIGGDEEVGFFKPVRCLPEMPAAAGR
jgi:hypothetical protein